MADDVAFSAVLDALLDKNNATRRSAEKYYFASIETMEGVAKAASELLNSMATSPNERVRLLSAVLLRRLLSRRECKREEGSRWKLLAEVAPGCHDVIRAGVLSAFTNEPKGYLKLKIAHTIAELASFAAGKGGADWPDLLPGVFAMVQSDDVNSRKTALFLFARLAESNGEELMGEFSASLKESFPALLAEGTPLPVRVAAVDAIISLIISLTEREARDAFQDLTPAMFGVLEASLMADQGDGQEVLMQLVALLQSDNGAFLRPSIHPACTSMMAIASHEDFEDRTRKLALEFMTNLAEVAGSMLRKMPDFIRATTRLSLQLMTMVDDDLAAWMAGEDDGSGFAGDEASSDMAGMVIAGTSALDRVAMGVGGAAYWPIYMEVAAPLFASADWKERRAAVLGAGLVCEGCKKFLVKNVRDVVAGVLPFVTTDPHPRVRHAATRTLGELITTFSDPYAVDNGLDGIGNFDPTMATSVKSVGARGEKQKPLKSIQQAAGDLIVPALVTALSRELNGDAPRTRAAAAMCVINYSHNEHCELRHLGGGERDLLLGLFNVLEDIKTPSAQQSAMMAVGLLAQILDEGFGDYYPTFIPIAKGILEATSTALASGTPTPALSRLRGQVLQALSLIMQGVGKDVAGMDAAEMLGSILTQMRAESEQAGIGGSSAPAADADTYDYMMMAVVRIAAMMGTDFAPFLPMLMPMVLAAAAQTVGVEVIAATPDVAGPAEDDEESGKKIINISIAGAADQQIAIDHEALCTKLAALAALCNLLDDLGLEVKEMRDWLDQCAEVFVVSMRAPFASLREMAMNGTQHVLVAALADTANPARAQLLFNRFVDAFLLLVDEERQLEVLLTASEVMQTIFKMAYDSLHSGGGVVTPGGAGAVAAMEAAAIAERAAARAAEAAAGGAGATAAAGGAGATVDAKADEEAAAQTAAIVAAVSNPDNIAKDDAALAAALAPSGSAGGSTTAKPTSPTGEESCCVIVVPYRMLVDVLSCVQSMVESSRKRRSVTIEEAMENPDADEEDADRLKQELEPESNFIAFAMDCAGYCIKTHRENILAPLEESGLGPYLSGCLDYKDPFQEAVRSAAICMCDDLIEHASPASHSIVPAFMPAVLDAVTSEDTFQRQCAAYGLGVAAAFGGDGFLPHIGDALARLYGVVTAPESRSEENAFATENAVSSLLKIARFRRGAPGVDEDAIMGGVLSFLPFKVDDVEGRLVHGWMVEGLAAGDELWVGAGGSRLPALMRALADGLVAEQKRMGAAGGAGEGEEGEEDEDEEGDKMFSQATLATLNEMMVGIGSWPMGPAVVAAIKGLKKKQQAVFKALGLPEGVL